MRVEIRDDFDLDKIIGSGQCFRERKLKDGSYLFISGERILNILPLSDGEEVKDTFPKDEVQEQECRPAFYECSCTPDDWNGFWKDYFDLGRDYGAIRRICKEEIRCSAGQETKDPAGKERSSADGGTCKIWPSAVRISPDGAGFLKDAERAGRGLRILHQDPWEMLVTFILSQRKNIPAIAASVEKLARLYGHRAAGGHAGSEIFCFPTPEEMNKASERDLREAGLGYRASYVRDATDKVLSGELDLEAMKKLDDEQLFEELKRVKGVGKKVADCICLFGFGRTGRAPVDVWIERAIQRCGGIDPFPAFGEYAGIMQQYVFYYMMQGSKGHNPRRACT